MSLGSKLTNKMSLLSNFHKGSNALMASVRASLSS
jgi:hypothetical protein